MSITCPYCRNGNVAKRSSENGITSYQCLNCHEKFVQLDKPEPTATSIRENDSTVITCPYCHNDYVKLVGSNSSFSKYQCVGCYSIFSIKSDNKSESKTDPGANPPFISPPKCKTCDHVVALSAPKCPNCGETDPHRLKEKTYVGCFFIAICILLFFLISNYCFDNKKAPSSSSSVTNHGITVDKYTAISFAKQYVERFLSPRVCSYPWMEETLVEQIAGHGNRWSVIGYVDTQNIYGANIRLRYECLMDIKSDGSSASLIYLKGLN